MSDDDLLDKVQSMADGLACMSITDTDSGLRWAVEEISRLRQQIQLWRACAEETRLTYGGCFVPKDEQ